MREGCLRFLLNVLHGVDLPETTGGRWEGTGVILAAEPDAKNKSCFCKYIDAAWAVSSSGRSVLQTCVKVDRWRVFREVSRNAS